MKHYLEETDKVLGELESSADGLSLAEAEARLAKNGKNMEKKLYSVPREIDISVAKEKLKAGNIAIDTLSKEQEKYLNA